jgi:toxin ParE1/3/4
MAEYRVARSAEAAIDHILAWTQEKFGDSARERYAALLVASMEDVAATPDQAAVIWKRRSGFDFGVYHISHSRSHSTDPPGPVAKPRHYLVFRVGTDYIVDILGVVHERMLLSRALRQIAQANQREP